MPFRRITIVSVDGRYGELFGAQCALAYSLRELPGANALLLSPERPKLLLDGIRHVPIKPIGYLEYSLFLIYALHRFISTDFALIVQPDGWVLNGNQWHDDYFSYDYIGAPTHFARVRAEQKTTFQCNFQWINSLADPTCQVDVVLNGGFSLRSRRLLAAPTQLNLPYVLVPPTIITGPPYRMYWDSAPQNEDVQLCVNMRSDLESYGIKFAPLDVARCFAFEYINMTFHNGLNLSHCFGHHSSMRHLMSLNPLVVEYQLMEEELPTIVGENQVGEYLRRRGYVLQFAFSERPPDGVRKFQISRIEKD